MSDTNGKNEHTSGYRRQRRGVFVKTSLQSRDERMFDSLRLIHKSRKMVMDFQNHTNYFYYLYTPSWRFKATLL